jgi:hypothetical protein
MRFLVGVGTVEPSVGMSVVSGAESSGSGKMRNGCLHGSVKLVGNIQKFDWSMVSTHIVCIVNILQKKD